MDSLKIGLSQMGVLEGNIQENCKNLERIIEKHHKEGLDLLCFPELCISGYHYKTAAHSLNEEKIISDLAGKYHIPIIAGIILHENGNYYDAACLWDETGTLLLTYKKIHLWGDESRFFSSGQCVEIVSFRGWNIGILICADLGFSELSTALALNKADLVIYPSAWAIHFEELFQLAARMRAAENQFYTIGLNRGNIKKSSYCGNSIVCDPTGDTMLTLSTDEEDYAQVILQRHCVEEMREKVPWLSMRLPEVYKNLSH